MQCLSPGKIVIKKLKIMMVLSHQMGSSDNPCSLTWVTPNSDASLLLRAQPTPGSRSTVRPSRKERASWDWMRNIPLGLARLVASRASRMLGPMPDGWDVKSDIQANLGMETQDNRTSEERQETPMNAMIGMLTPGLSYCLPFASVY